MLRVSESMLMAPQSRQVSCQMSHWRTLNCLLSIRTITPSYCVVWGIQFSHGGRGMAATAVAKRNHCTGEAKSLYIENHYMSEPRFVPRPGATEEDDGVLIGMVFDGTTQQSRVQFVDAASLEVLATAPFAMKVPFPIHTTWFGASGEVTV